MSDMQELANIIPGYFPDQKFDISIITKDVVLIEFIVREILLTNNNADKIGVSSKLSEDALKNLKKISRKICRTNELKENEILTFFDFNGSDKVFGGNDNKFSYINLIQDNRLFRKKCKTMIFYKYSGSEIHCGYWKHHDKPTDNITIMKICRWGEIVQSLPKPPSEVMNTLNNREKSIEYVNSLKEFFLSFIELCFEEEKETNPEMVNDILQICQKEESIAELIVAFTHPSVSELNYENTEHRGDRISISLLSEAMHTKFSRLTPSEASSYALYYSSAKSQRVFSDDMQLVERMMIQNFVYKKARNEADEAIKDLLSDIFESLLGCIAKIFSDHYFSGSQLMIGFKIMSLITESLPFSRDLIRGDSKKQVLQLLEMYDPDLAKTIYLKNDTSQSTLRVVVVEPLISFLNDRDVKIASELTGKTERYGIDGIKRSDCESSLWTKILNILEINGISRENIHGSLKDNLGIIRNNFRPLYNEFVEFLRVKYPDENPDDVLRRVVFSLKKAEGYISMNILPYNFKSKSEYYNGITFPVIQGQREEDIYANTVNVIMDNRKLACVAFPENQDIPADLLALKFNPKSYGQLLCIKQVLGK